MLTLGYYFPFYFPGIERRKITLSYDIEMSC